MSIFSLEKISQILRLSKQVNSRQMTYKGKKNIAGVC